MQFNWDLEGQMLDINFAWDAYPDHTFDGYRIKASLTLTDFVVVKEITNIATTSATVTAPGYGAYNYMIQAFKGGLEAPPSPNVNVDIPVAAVTGFHKV